MASLLNKIPLRVPPLKNALNVAWQTVQQQMPEKSRGEYSEPPEGGPPGRPPPPRPQQNVRFANFDNG